MSCAKPAGPTDMPYRETDSCGSKEPCTHWHHLVNTTTERSVRGGGDAASCRITLTTCCREKNDDTHRWRKWECHNCCRCCCCALAFSCTVSINNQTNNSIISFNCSLYCRLIDSCISVNQSTSPFLLTNGPSNRRHRHKTQLNLKNETNTSTYNISNYVYRIWRKTY